MPSQVNLNLKGLFRRGPLRCGCSRSAVSHGKTCTAISDTFGPIMTQRRHEDRTVLMDRSPAGFQPGRLALTSSSRLLCSFCCSMRFCLSASSWRLYSSCSRSCCSWRSCWRRSASERSLFSCCSLMKSRRSVDSPGTLTMELRGSTEGFQCLPAADGVGTYSRYFVLLPRLAFLFGCLLLLLFTAAVFILCLIWEKTEMPIWPLSPW